MLTNVSQYSLSQKNLSEQLQQYDKSGSDHSLWKFESIPVTIILVIIMSVVPILTISGNCLVVWAILTQKCLQQVQNRLLISLAVADILVALIVMPFAIFMEVAGRYFLKFSPNMKFSPIGDLQRGLSSFHG